MLMLLALAESATGQIFRALAIDDTRDFEIEDEDSTVSQLYKITSDLMVENLDVHQMKFTQARQKGDTLTILIFETHPSLGHEYWIKIVKDRYTIDYRFEPGGDVKRKINAEGFGLILNTTDVGPGKELRGYTEYRGNCVKGCKDKLVTIRGNFKVKIE